MFDGLLGMCITAFGWSFVAALLSTVLGVVGARD